MFCIGGSINARKDERLGFLVLLMVSWLVTFHFASWTPLANRIYIFAFSFCQWAAFLVYYGSLSVPFAEVRRNV